MYPSPAIQQAIRTLQLALGALAVGSLVVACGGGSGVGSAGTGSTGGTYSSGTISGFGSVIVNGVRFDTTDVTVSDEDEDSSSPDDSVLQLGMEVEVEAGRVASSTDGSTPIAKAARIAHGSALLGPVGSVNAAGLSLVVLGQTVKVTDATIFDASLAGGLAALKPGDVVNVHGLFDKVSGETTASRVELKTSAVPFYRMRGVVSDLDTTAKTLKIGGQPVSYAAALADKISSSLANGQVVRTRLETIQVAGVWSAVRIKSAEQRLHDQQENELEGLITSFTSKSDFRVNGLPVDASLATFSDGTASDLRDGVRVEVEGTVSNGVLVATRVEFRKGVKDKERQFEFHGAIASLDTVNKTFVLRGTTISYGDLLNMEASLVNGVRVEIKGTRSTDGTQINAVRIKLEDSQTKS